MLITTITNIINSILFSLLAFVINKKCTKEKMTKYNLMLFTIFILLFTITCFIPYNLFLIKAIAIAFLFVTINLFLNNYIFNISIAKSLIEYLIIIICYCLSLMIVTTCSLHYSFENYILSNTFHIIFSCLLSFALIIVYLVTRKKDNYINNLELHYNNLSFIVIFTIFFSLVPTFLFFSVDYRFLDLKITLYYLLIMSFLNIYIIFLNNKFCVCKQKCDKLEIENKKMSNLIDGARVIKHDYSNIFQTINGYLCTNNYEKLNTYVGSILKEFNILNNISALNTDTFDEPGVYGIVGSKQFYANTKGLLFDIDVTVKVSEIKFYMPKLCRILGILLDNAIEAALKSNEKYIKLEIHYNQMKNAHIIRVYNTFNDEEKIDLNKIYDKGYSSKEVKSGIGLWEVKRIIACTQNSQIYATLEKEYFVQNIIIEN